MKDQLVGGKTVEEWDREWVKVPGGFMQPDLDMSHQAGLYRADEDGRIMVIGKSSEKRGTRLKKRFADFSRLSDSARKYKSGNYIHDNIERLDAFVLMTGSDKNACELANQLRKVMIKLHSPVVNCSQTQINNAIANKAKNK